MEKKITTKQLKETLAGDIDKLIDQVVQAINDAQPGRIIADSEEPVRDACAEFRQRLYQESLSLRQQLSEPSDSTPPLIRAAKMLPVKAMGKHNIISRANLTEEKSEYTMKKMPKADKTATLRRRFLDSCRSAYSPKISG